MQTAPPPVAPPANPIVVDPLADVSNRLAAIEHRFELILQHLLHPAKNNGALCTMAPACIARQTPMFAASPPPQPHPSNLESITANWSWEWGSVPALPLQGLLPCGMSIRQSNTHTKGDISCATDVPSMTVIND